VLFRSKFIIIAGPCVIEKESFTFDLAIAISNILNKFDNIEWYFKASFDKANRTSINSYRGVGITEGARILSNIRNQLNLKTITDIHESYQAEIIKNSVDIIQIPAFLARQTDLIIAAAKTGKIVNVKKGQFMAPWDMKNVVRKLEESGNNKILLTERGSSFGYNNLVVDMTAIKEMQKFGYPVIFDATHSVQKPGGLGDKTGGNREYIETLAYATIASGADGIFVEVHPDPNNALSDGPNSLKLDRLEQFIKNIVKLKSTIDSF
jgi:2-dehydro-3-deoxyphosphooctonate aldolase (KDO 8-P synthase)